MEDTRGAIASAEGKVDHVATDATLLEQANEHNEIARLARQETSKLHSGDESNQQLWDEFLPACLAALNQILCTTRCPIRSDAWRKLLQPNAGGRGQRPEVAGDWRQTATAPRVSSLTAMKHHSSFRKQTEPTRTQTTDLATIQYRLNELNADEIVYVVDKRQSEHFSLLFRTCELWGLADVKCQHVSFGTVMGNDGKAIQDPFR